MAESKARLISAAFTSTGDIRAENLDNVPPGGLDSADVVTLIDSDYVRTRADSAYLENIIDSAYVSARSGGGGGLGVYGVVNSTGTGASATGTDAIAIGENAKAGDGASVAIGKLSGNQVTGAYNVSIGPNALRAAGSVNYTVAIGERAAELSQSSNSVYIGNECGKNKTGTGNTAVGDTAMKEAIGSGYGNTAIGRGALLDLTGGYENAALGWNAGQNITTGYQNTFLGRNTGANVSTGYGNIAIGRFADTGNNNECIIIGYNAYVSNPGAQSGQNAQVVLGSSLQGKGANTAFIKGPAYQSNNSSSWSTTSDERVKTNITDYTLGLDALSQVNVKTFNYRSDSDIATNSPELAGSNGLVNEGLDTEKTDVGIIAQELELILPNTITTRDNGMKSVNKDELFWVMLNSIKELKTANDSLVARVEALENA